MELTQKSMTELILPAINNRPVEGAKTWVLCYDEGNFLCIPKKCCKRTAPIFLTFKENELTEGFTSKQWDELFGRIFSFFGEDKK